MNKCISCGHIRHDLALNCPKCGSFYSTFEGHIPTEIPKNTHKNAATSVDVDLDQELDEINVDINDELSQEIEGASMKNDRPPTPKKMSFFGWLRHPVKIQIKYIIITAGILLMLTIRIFLCN